MLTLLGFYHLIPRRLQPAIRVLALLVVLVIVVFSVIAFTHVLVTLPSHQQRHDTSKQRSTKEAR
jgi:hypothetical protein